MDKNHQKVVIPKRMVRIDEDEEECLRRLAEPNTTTTKTARYPHQKAKQATNSSNNKTNNMSSRVCSNTNNKKKVQDNVHIIGDHDHDHDYAHEVKKEVTPRPNKEKKVMNNNKLETKKSEDINESAENFIQKFKQQLILQRLESIENVEKMLQRGL